MPPSGSATRAIEDAIREAPADAIDAATRLLRMSQTRDGGTAIVRTFAILADLISRLDPDTLDEVTRAPTDADALLRLLDQPAIIGLVRESDPLADARLRWIRDRQRLLTSEGHPLPTHDVCDLLGVSRQAVAKARAEHRLVGVPDSRGSYLYPSWQFGPSGPLPGLRPLVQALGDDDPWTLIAFVLAPNPRLDDQRPLDRLRRGDLDVVLRAAAAYGEHGAA